MANLSLVIGNKRYSSWSLRAWLALKLTGQPFKEIWIGLDQPTTKAEIARYSQSGRVPVLLDGELQVWDTLAIGEYLAERFPGAGLWPSDVAARAQARSIVAEMHSGFTALRANMSMDLIEKKPGQGRAPGVAEDIARICQIWRETRLRFGKGGAFLFGTPTLADCFYAPVATRFDTYAVDLPAEAAAYRDTILSWPLFLEWKAPAKDEPTLHGH